MKMSTSLHFKGSHLFFILSNKNPSHQVDITLVLVLELQKERTVDSTSVSITYKHAIISEKDEVSFIMVEYESTKIVPGCTGSAWSHNRPTN